MTCWSMCAAASASSESSPPPLRMEGMEVSLEEGLPAEFVDLYAKIRFIGDDEDTEFEGNGGSGVKSGGTTPAEQQYVCDFDKYKKKCENERPKVGIGGSCGGYYADCKCPKKYCHACALPNVDPDTSFGAVNSQCDGKYQACKCAAGYDKTCNHPYKGSDEGCALPVAGSQGCPEGAGGKTHGTVYKACVCKDEFRYTSGNCSGDYRPGGETCEGKYNQCNCTATATYCEHGCETTNCAGCTSCAEPPTPPPPPADPCDTASETSESCANNGKGFVSCGSKGYCSGSICSNGQDWSGIQKKCVDGVSSGRCLTTEWTDNKCKCSECIGSGCDVSTFTQERCEAR